MTKSYNYIPTHFLYSPLLFFLLIFMHQLIHCHTLLQPFSKIFLFRIYVPTTYTPAMLDFDLDETSVSGFHKHTRQTAPANQSTATPSTKSPRPYSPHKPIHQRHCPTNKPSHRYHAHTAPQTHTDTHTAPQPPTRRQAPPTTLTTHREAMPYLDVDVDALDADAASARFVPLQSDRPDRLCLEPHTGSGHALAIEPARYQTGSD